MSPVIRRPVATQPPLTEDDLRGFLDIERSNMSGSERPAFKALSPMMTTVVSACGSAGVVAGPTTVSQLRVARRGEVARRAAWICRCACTVAGVVCRG